MSVYSQHHTSDAHFHPGRPYPRPRTLSISSTTSSSASSAYGWGGAAPIFLTPSPQPLPGLPNQSDPAWGAFVPSSMHNSGLGATNALLRFVRAPPHTTQNSPSKSGTRPGTQGSGPASDFKRRQDRRRSPNPKTVTFDLQPHFFVKTDLDRSRSSPLSKPSLRHPLPPPSASSSATSSASSSRDPSPGRDSRDQSDDDDFSPPSQLRHSNAPGSGLHPVLARVERASKFCAGMMVCATCSKQGRDYPACGKCKKMWCSRECRLQGGKRHVC